MNEIILVDEDDNEIGVMDKMEVHRLGKLHRAFSILIFNSKGELLLQKRAQTKYHSGGLWTNTCCSHHKPGEPVIPGVRRQLLHEMGIDVEPKFIFKFKYRAALDNNLIEHEIDHVFTGTYEGAPNLNLLEAEDWRFESLSNVRQWMKEVPDQFTIWFKKIVEFLPEHVHQ